jgi:subtilase family serine protease
MLRRFTVATASIAVLASLVSIPALGASASPAIHAKRVCPVSTSATRVQCFSWIRTDAAGRPLVIRPDVSGYGPSEFHSAYNLPTTSSTNQTIAIVDAYRNPNVVADLNVYNAQFGLPSFPKCTTPSQTSCIMELNQNGKRNGLPRGDVGWGLEIALDVQVAHAICQNCRILLFEARSNSFSDIATAVNSAARLGANVISNSYGSYGFDCSQTGYNHPNVAVTVSSGDSGFGISCPANENTVISVGGTTLTLDGNGNYVSESVWNGSGSGCSSIWSAQSWQTANPNWSSTGCGTKRGMNDVAADADPGTGAAVYDTYGYSGWLQVGGTSLSSPLVAAVYALASNSSNWAYPAQSAYDNAGSLHDVTTGSNGSCSFTLQCNAAAGYDLPTGIGTPNGLGGF